MHWIPITGKPTKCSDKPSRISAAKISVKDQNVVLLSNEEDVLGRWREYFKDVSNPTTLTPSNTQEVRLARKGPSLQLRSS